ncbi:MAG: hypothetical protein R3E91_03095 [Chlamydiales bacterium]
MMKEIEIQLRAIWKQIRPVQKITVVLVIFFILAFLGYLMIRASSRHVEKSLFVEEEQTFDSITTPRGFELFDTNTWIKGDKELQVLEMRALKGQLERDLVEFEQIKNANVILDMPPVRSFGGSSHKTKASVILELNPEAILSSSQLRAVIYHLAGAVHGLEPNMIAISDTKGKLYTAIDPEGQEELLSNAALVFEEHLNQKIEMLLAFLIGKGRYISSVQAGMERGKEQPYSLSVVVVIDQEFEKFLTDIENQIHTILLGYDIPSHIKVSLFSFEKEKKLLIHNQESKSYIGVIVILLTSLLILAALYPFFRKYSKQKQEDNLFRVMTRIDIQKLAESIENEDPQTIALMLSYLEPIRAEKLITFFPQELQEEIFKYLSEIEYESN